MLAGIYEIFCGNKNFYVGKQPDPFPGTSNTVCLCVCDVRVITQICNIEQISCRLSSFVCNNIVLTIPFLTYRGSVLSYSVVCVFLCCVCVCDISFVAKGLNGLGWFLLKSVCCDFSIFSAAMPRSPAQFNLVRNSVLHSPSSVTHHLQ